MRFVVGLSTLIPSPANINHTPINHALVGYETRYPLVNLWKITIFLRQINYRWQFSIAMLNYQRVFGTILDTRCPPRCRSTCRVSFNEEAVPGHGTIRRAARKALGNLTRGVGAGRHDRWGDQRCPRLGRGRRWIVNCCWKRRGSSSSKWWMEMINMYDIYKYVSWKSRKL